jgi:uncharacterized protein involved in exopolysaccharide biosynthesis
VSAKKDAPPADADERRLEAQRAAGAANTKRYLAEHQAELAAKAKRGAARIAELEKQAKQDDKAAKAD